MESGFVFTVTSIDDALTPQLSRVLERCAHLASRKQLPVLWQLSDWLNRVPKSDPEVLQKRRKREGVLGIILWAVSMFLLIPSAMEPKALAGPLLLSVLGFLMSCVAMKSTKRTLMGGLNLAMGILLCLGALLAFDSLKALLAPGALCLAAGVWALVGKRRRQRESGFDRQARELVRQRRTVANLERARVEFNEQGMVLSDGTDVDAQCFEYPEFFFVAETEALLVSVCGQRAVVLQKKDLQEGSMEQLRVFLQEHVSYERVEMP
ncbi:hypothetical protein [Allofournierella sp. CML151]|uniref:hypothetical protein n=1 Tax=Allofournierella sp. CML151 TaxID=2998082 RepID=UPI0022EAF609|nr:hypothetical protein [Fournierella sp. CML151]